jgi:hypothetical protein
MIMEFPFIFNYEKGGTQGGRNVTISWHDFGYIRGEEH